MRVSLLPGPCSRRPGSLRLQAEVVHLTARKDGDLADGQLKFLLAYTGRSVELCPQVRPFFLAAYRRLFERVGRFRGVDGAELYERSAQDAKSAPLAA
jgi:hypothetical protein